MTRTYEPLPTLRKFHESPAQIRCIVGPVGSGKTTAAAWEMCYYVPMFLFQKYGIRETRWCVVRNTYRELIDTTQKTIFDWFTWGNHVKSTETYFLKWPDNGPVVEIMFRSCDRSEDIKKFKSLEITGYWADESIEINQKLLNMLKNRIGRFPRQCPVRFGIETTNPPDVEHPAYSMYHWNAPPPGPLPKHDPLKNHAGFWQPPGENSKNLPPGYYTNLRSDYHDFPDMIDMYIDGKPGVQIQGRLVYNNFRRDTHVAVEPIARSGGKLYLGWDHSGITPAAVLIQIPSPMRAQVLREYYSERMGIVDFGNYVINSVNMDFPNEELTHFGDPAGSQQFSKKEGGFTSNSKLLEENCEVVIIPSEQNPRARIESVDQALARIDGLLIDPSCTRLIDGFLGGYCYPENKSIMGEFLPTILKNKYSHVHDALQYAMVRLFKPVTREDFIPQMYEKEEYERYDYLND